MTLPSDFRIFWNDALITARACHAPNQYTTVPSPFAGIDIYDVRFPGFEGNLIAGWLLLPREPTTPRPTIVWYPGYGSGRGSAHEWVTWAAAGYGILAVDVRGQGGDWGGSGVTPDPGGSGPAASGSMTRGIESPGSYFYKRVIIDCVRAIDAVRSHPRVDARQIVAAGGSQGGGLALAVAGLVPDLMAVVADVPFMCDFEHAVRVFESGPYSEIARYLSVQRSSRDTVFDTLAYFDAVNFARQSLVPALFSAGLVDGTCPPSTVFAAFNSYQGPKDIDVYEFNGHEGGGGLRWPRHLSFLKSFESGDPRALTTGLP